MMPRLDRGVQDFAIFEEDMMKPFVGQVLGNVSNMKFDCRVAAEFPPGNKDISMVNIMREHFTCCEDRPAEPGRPGPRSRAQRHAPAQIARCRLRRGSGPGRCRESP